MTKPIKLFWWKPGPGLTNYGDALSPLVVEALSGRPVVPAPIPRSDLVAIGSLLQRVYPCSLKFLRRLRMSPLHIWGTGTLVPIEIKKRAKLVFHAVRGKETGEIFGLRDDIPIGDPALLLSRMISSVVEKRYRWGIVPHFTHHSDATAAVSHFRNTLPNSIVIDLMEPDIHETTMKIRACDFIASSSLHGVIVADAFGIPNVWTRLADPATFDLKFADYFASVDRTNNAVTDWRVDQRLLESQAVAADASKIACRCDSLERAFKAMNL